MDPSEQGPGRPERPGPPPLPYVALQERVERLGDRLSGWWLARGSTPAPTPFVPDTETVALDVRRHGLVLAWPLARTVAGVLALLGGGLLLIFATTVAGWSLNRIGGGLQRTAVVTAVAVGVVLVAPWHLALVLLLVWCAEDVADWWCDRLVVTDKRIYRRYGVVTAHAPSISLTAIAFIDAAVPPLGRAFGYGTLRLDSVAQRDAPLSRLDFIPDVTAVTHRVLELRASAMPRTPPPSVF